MYFDDLTVGQRFVTEPVMVTKEDILSFAAQYDPLALHMDEQTAADSVYGGIIASGYHTLCLIWGQWVRLGIVNTEVIGGLGIDSLRWTAPVYPNDTLSAVIEVAALTPFPKVNRGMLTVKVTAMNGEGKVIMEAQVNSLIKTREAGEQHAPAH